MDIDGKVAMVTGASAGIGLATARRFAQAGAKLALVARSKGVLRGLENELKSSGVEAAAMPADMRSREEATWAVEETVRRFGRVDILINNAGQAAAGTVEKVDPEDFRQIIELNIFGPLYAMQAAIPVMRRQGGGIIMNVSSMVSKMHIPGLSAYAATKVALNMMSDTARIELALDKIRVITVYPRLTSTDFGKHSLGNRELRGQQRANPDVPIDTPEHVADRILAAAVSEPEEQYMTQAE